MTQQTDIAIIGGGLAGLALADHLHRAGRDFIVIEARHRLGGRIKTLRDGGAAFDLGPSWFWPGQPRMATLAERLGLPVFDQYAAGEPVFQDEEGTVHRAMGLASMEGSLRLDGGMGALIDGLAKTLPSGSIHLGQPVVSVSKNERDLTVALAGDTTITARQIVLALPPRVAANLTLSPALTSAQTRALQDVPTWMGGQAKFVATFDTPFWRDAGLSGDAMSRHGPMIEIHDASAASGTPAALFGFIGVPAIHRAAQPDALKTACIAQLGQLFGSQALFPRMAMVQDWATKSTSSTPADHTSSGSHPAYGLPRALASVWDDLLHFGSTEMAGEFGGYLEGALARAEEIAAQLANTGSSGSGD